MLEVGQLSLIQAANEVVNQVFYGPMLREMRDSTQNPYFGNGPGGKTFMRQLDMEMMKRMNGDRPSALAKSLVRELGQNREAQLRASQVMNVKDLGNG